MSDDKPEDLELMNYDSDNNEKMNWSPNALISSAMIQTQF